MLRMPPTPGTSAALTSTSVATSANTWVVIEDQENSFNVTLPLGFGLSASAAD